MKISSVQAGSCYLWRGFKLLNSRELLPFIWAPLIINIIFFIGMLLLGIHETQKFTAWFMGFLPTWLHWLSWLIWLLFAVAGILLITYTFSVAANLIAVPFNGLLAERVESLVTGHSSPTNSWLAFVKSIPFAIKQQLRVLGYYLPRMIVCLLCFFIPLVQIFAAIIWFLFHAWVLNLQYLTYPMENHLQTFTATRKQAAEKWPLTLSFGVTVTIISMIPIINLLVIPAAVAGATLLWIENYKV